MYIIYAYPRNAATTAIYGWRFPETFKTLVEADQRFAGLAQSNHFDAIRLRRADDTTGPALLEYPAI